MKKFLVVILVLFSFNVFAVDNATFAVKGEKIYSPTLMGSFIIYVMAPDRLAGWSGEFKQYEKEYIQEKYQKLPIFGGWQGQPIDENQIKAHNVKKAFVIGDPEKSNPRIDALKAMGMDVLILKANTIEDYPSFFRELGRQMGLPDRGNELASYGEEMLEKTRAMLKNMPDTSKKTVFAGSGPDGLSAICFMDALEIAGGKNAYNCPADAVIGSEKQFSFEQLLALDPEVIIVTNPAGRRVLDDPKWHELTAYKNGQLYVPPYGPFGWLHHFTPFTRFIGTPWLACKLYPDKCTIDIEKETKRFYKLFMNINLSDKQLNQILYRK